MNTILQKRIEEAAKKYAAKIEEQNPNSEAYNIDGNFITGATFALQNQWISVEEALPKFGELILVDGKTGLKLSIYMNTFADATSITNSIKDVTHWMEIPSLKGGEK